MAADRTVPLTPRPTLARPADQILHPWAWWAWALGVAIAVNLTTNPLFLVLVGLALLAVILLRRSDAPWARSISAYFWLAGVVIGVRMFFRILVGGGFGETVLFTLPEIPLPDWAQGIRLGGDVTLEGILYTLYDSLRLVVMLVAVAAANALANPRRALRAVPAALHDISVSVVIALSVAPQLVESAFRVRTARRLRGGRARGLDAVKAYLVPILADAVDRSVSLAASMEARGFGRTRTTSRRRTWTNALLLVSSMVATLGGFLLLSSSGDPGPVAFGCLGAGALGVVAGLRASRDKIAVTRYRPDPWGIQEWTVTVSGLLVLAIVLALGNESVWALFGATLDPDVLNPSFMPATWPSLHPALVVAAALTALPILVTRAPGRTPPATRRGDAAATGRTGIADPGARRPDEELVTS
ncbi:CbiQ family ECF transporter T component [Propionicicella superfundia]|uniref:CbiQ family ECF transporter T component n=1 Tax=Propionicicella superfundia TaxID=348582 RepID=UPI00042157A4|nr:CbiQ family ECF transporter T component [Propionicicella superfundia]